MNALITNIQRFSLTDGPGIRTTVFFQGCNMHCEWCHNPETLPLHPVLMHYENKCIGCGKCLTNCTQHAHSIVDGKHVIDRSKCVSCGVCASKCFADALVMSSRPYSIEDVMQEITQDKIYYKESSGGVTLSGGEVCLQAEFAEELTDRCHANEIDVAIETNMNLPFTKISSLLNKVDLVMCDLKIYDSINHKKWTGTGNEIIIENIKRASELGKPIIVRTPLIPNATDTIENINSIIAFLNSLNNITRYELLNFNPLGSGKYDALHINNVFANALPFNRKQLEAFKKNLSETRFELKIQ